MRPRRVEDVADDLARDLADHLTEDFTGNVRIKDAEKLATEADNRKCNRKCESYIAPCPDDQEDCYHEWSADTQRWCPSCRKFYRVAVVLADAAGEW